MFLSVAVAFFVLSSPFAYADNTKKPGVCAKSTECPTDYTCVSVYSSIPGIENLQQCAPNDVCSGKTYGSCPTFSSWPVDYRQVQPICAFKTDINNCYNVSNPNATKDDEYVDCYGFRGVNVDNTSEFKNVEGIYQCQDLTNYKKGNDWLFQANLDAQVEACKGEKLLCNGHGTCLPKGMFSAQYECKCNKGYKVEDNCLEPISNECDNLGQCGEQGTCNTDEAKCSCVDGATGNQCSKCKEGDAKACNGHGTCNSDGKCTCSGDWKGTFCTEGDIIDDSAAAHNGLQWVTMVIGSILAFAL